MTAIRCILLLFLANCTNGSTTSVDFKLKGNETTIEEVELEQDYDPSSSSHFLALQTSSPVSVLVSKDAKCAAIPLLETAGSADIEIPLDTWHSVMECGFGKNKGKLYFHVASEELPAHGTLSFYTNRAVLRAEPTTVSQLDANRFQVSENNAYTRKIKLESLADSVEIRLTSENVENALDVYITFCATNKGILYTTSYAPSLDITLRSPRMELYYDAYSCDSNITFYSNSSQPVSPLIIRLESQYTINGTISVFVNGKEPNADSHVAQYETGTYTVNGGEQKTFELRYRSNVQNIHAFLDVVTGSISVYLSPCKTVPMDVYYSDFAISAHQIDINLENLIANTTCSLLEIDASTVFLTVRPSATSTFTLWIPGERATWHIAVFVAVVLLLLAVAMLLIVHFGRRKTGKLVINYFQ
ncbi:unnamed protein product [Caenorhabditis sp. 36 PRJEB53466]|nr:unnamed protein product [Caenorhabditis sp. 36 PRJEB53466]